MNRIDQANLPESYADIIKEQISINKMIDKQGGIPYVSEIGNKIHAVDIEKNLLGSLLKIDGKDGNMASNLDLTSLGTQYKYLMNDTVNLNREKPIQTKSKFAVESKDEVIQKPEIRRPSPLTLFYHEENKDQKITVTDEKSKEKVIKPTTNKTQSTK